MNNRVVRTEIIGHCPVDSGTIMVIDPCYVLDDERVPDPKGTVFGYTSEYLRNVMPTCEAPFYGGVQPNEYDGQLGVVSRTLYGDGCYPVIAEFNSDGRVVRLTIDFDPDVDDYDEDEDGYEYGYEYTCDECGDDLPDGDGVYRDNGMRVCASCEDSHLQDEE